MNKKPKKTRSIRVGSFTGSLQTHPKGTSWYCSYYYTDPSGKRIQAQRSLKCPIATTPESQAVQIMTDFLIELNHKTASVVDLRSTVVDMANAWHESIKSTVRPNTYERYGLNLKKIHSYFGERNTLMIDLDRSKVRAYQTYLLERGKRNQRTGALEPMAPVSVHDQISVLSQICEYAIDAGIITHNPCTGIRTKASHSAKTEKYMDYDTAERFIGFCEDNADEAITNIIKAAINFGLRKSEILGLRMQDLDLNNHRLCIRSTVTATTTLHIEEATKTATSMRIIPLSDQEVQFFQDILAQKKANKKWFGNTYHDSDYVFTQINGKPYAPNQIYKITKRLLIRFGEPDLTFHSLRHTYASILYANDVDIKTAQRLMGHASPETTMKIYTHIGRSKLESQNVGLLGGGHKNENK